MRLWKKIPNCRRCVFFDCPQTRIASRQNAFVYDGCASGRLYYFGARYYDPRTSVWQSADPILGKYLPSGNKDHDSNLAGMGGIYNPLNIGLYGYAAQNPVKFSDPDGRAFGIDDVVGAVVGGLINLSIQGWKDILSGGEGTYGESAGAFTSGAIAGVAAVNIPETAGASVTAIAAGGASAAGNAVQQGVDKGVNNIDLKEVATHGVLGAALGGVLHKLIPNTPIPGLSSGRNSAKAVAEGVKTKIARGTARIMSATTAAKAAAGSKAADAVRGVVADKAEDEAAHMLHHEDQKAEPHHED